MIRHYKAVMIFNKKHNTEKNRFEIADDFSEEFENCDVMGCFYLFQNETDKQSEEDVFLVDLKFDDVKFEDLYFYYAGRVANASYYTDRIIELHVLDETDFQQLIEAINREEFDRIKKKVIVPDYYLVFKNGNLDYFGKMYDALGYLD